MVEFPVLVTGYNRPELMRDLLQHLSQIGVENLYIALDGPKNLQDKLKCLETLNEVLQAKNRFDLKILHRRYNLGCCLGMISAIDWFFSKNDFGIVIEDDCKPSKEFFELVNDFFEKKADNSLNCDIVSAHNPFNTKLSNNKTSFVLIHGWATYSRVWKLIRPNYFKLNLPKFKNLKNETRAMSSTLYCWRNAMHAKLGMVDTWDGIMSDQVWRLGVKTLLPNENMVQNLGYGLNATHTKSVPIYKIDFTETNQALNSKTDYFLAKYYFKIKPRHIVTSWLRVLTDFWGVLNRKNFEKLLEVDSELRYTNLP
jgi:hypothetical protein